MRSLHIVESQLRSVRGRRGRQMLRSWERHSSLLARAGLGVPGDIPEWLAGLDRHKKDVVVRDLVGLAQRGDEVAVLVVLVCLRPGLLNLVRRFGVPVDEVVAEAVVAVLECPLGRRRNVIAGILLDVRHRLWTESLRPEAPLGECRDVLEDLTAPGELGVTLTSAEQLFDLVCGAWRTGVLNTIAARLIVETRILGDPISVTAGRLGMRPHAALVRRRRAECRLAEVAAALGRSYEQHQVGVLAASVCDLRRHFRLTAVKRAERCNARPSSRTPGVGNASDRHPASGS